VSGGNTGGIAAANGLGSGRRSGRSGCLRGGLAEVADGAGGFPGIGKAGASFGFAEAEDETQRDLTGPLRDPARRFRGKSGV
jgi:hypothetical protein